MIKMKEAIQAHKGKLNIAGVQALEEVYISRGTCESCAYAILLGSKWACTRAVPNIEADSFCDKFESEVQE